MLVSSNLTIPYHSTGISSKVERQERFYSPFDLRVPGIFRDFSALYSDKENLHTALLSVPRKGEFS